MEGLALPTGAVYGPNCGVTAVAIAAGVPFQTAWDLFAVGRRGGWTGGTRHTDRIAVLDQLGVGYEDHPVTERRTLQHVVRRLDPAKTYMIRTTGHVQIVRNRAVIDQRGACHISTYHGRRKFVSCVTEITA